MCREERGCAKKDFETKASFPKRREEGVREGRMGREGEGRMEGYRMTQGPD